MDKCTVYIYADRLIRKRLKLMDIAGSRTITIKEWEKIKKIFEKRDIIKTKELENTKEIER